MVTLSENPAKLQRCCEPDTRTTVLPQDIPRHATSGRDDQNNRGRGLLPLKVNETFIQPAVAVEGYEVLFLLLDDLDNSQQLKT